MLFKIKNNKMLLIEYIFKKHFNEKTYLLIKMKYYGYYCYFLSLNFIISHNFKIKLEINITEKYIMLISYLNYTKCIQTVFLNETTILFPNINILFID